VQASVIDCDGGLRRQHLEEFSLQRSWLLAVDWQVDGQHPDQLSLRRVQRCDEAVLRMPRVRIV
jgi:hypothetical protein